MATAREDVLVRPEINRFDCFLVPGVSKRNRCFADSGLRFSGTRAMLLFLSPFEEPLNLYCMSNVPTETVLNDAQNHFSSTVTWQFTATSGSIRPPQYTKNLTLVIWFFSQNKSVSIFHQLGDSLFLRRIQTTKTINRIGWLIRFHLSS